VLKYRVRPPADGARSGPEAFDDWLSRTEPARNIAIADAQQAMRIIRGSSRRYGLAPDRVGMIGFSAGAITTLAVAVGEPAVRPDFAVAGYGALPPGKLVPVGAPPLFVVAAADDPQAPAAKSVEAFKQWSKAKVPVELHLYAEGGHGFGMRTRDLPLDAWPSALEAWLKSNGFIGKAR
jgi:predicted esterase